MTESKTNKFLKIAEDHKKSSKREKFSGSFSEFLELLEKDKTISHLAHKRLYNSITSKGITRMSEEDSRCNNLFNGDALKTYDYFQSKFFGMERSLSKIMRYLHSAAMKGEESKQVLLLLGPVGAGKSALVEHIKRALESSGTMYALKDCPINESPLHLIPRSLREQFKEIYGVHIEGDLCPVCRHRLLEEHKGDYMSFPVHETTFSIRGRRGVGVVPPMDANTQDTSILIGSEDISKLDLYPEDDPRALSLNGAFNVGNRGIVEFVEVFKNEIEFLHTMITATQEKAIPSPGKVPSALFGMEEAIGPIAS